MQLKYARDIDWQDLPLIEDPVFARSDIKEAFFHDAPIWGITEILRNETLGVYAPERDSRSLARLLELLEGGEIFLVHDFMNPPFSPVLQWKTDSEEKGKGRWVVSPSAANSFIAAKLKWVVSRLSPRNSGGAAVSSVWDKVVGGAKELVNQVAAENNALKQEWFAESGIFSYTDQATGQALSPAEVAERYRNDSAPLLETEGPDEAAGAQAVHDFPQTPALIGAVSALGSHGRSALHHPQALLDDLKQALTHSRSETEALGELGMRQAHRRLGIESDPRYVNRYHGPDDIGHQNKRLTETEAKASQDDRVRVARDSKKNRQGSKKKNRLRAEKMKRKEQQGKVGEPSSRQGGPYTEAEMELWTEVKLNKGDKQHLLIHTNTETGVVRTFKQVDGGKVGEKLDEFEVENFKDAKSMIEDHFNKIREQAKK